MQIFLHKTLIYSLNQLINNHEKDSFFSDDGHHVRGHIM